MTQSSRRRPLALLSLVAVFTVGIAGGLALVQNGDLGLSNDVSGELAGIEGEEIPLPSRSQLLVTPARAHG